MALRGMTASDYNSNVDVFREREYPMLKDAIYLDHAGTTLYSKSLMEQFTADMISNLYGNPHSASPSSQSSTIRIEDIRLQVLQFFNADTDDFDVIFVANATAAIKLVMEAFRGRPGGFDYGYHKDAHTSLVGVREISTWSRCMTDQDVEEWLSGTKPSTELQSGRAGLFAYPAQSNMDGRRLPLSWAGRLRNLESITGKRVYSLLDAAALVPTSPLDLSDANVAPDFTVLSFNKIFGFPDLGALIVRKETGQVLRERKYFGGGTVDTVVCLKEQWHASKAHSLHDCLEDGTLPIHSIMALETAMRVHRNLYESMEKVSKHTKFLAKMLCHDLSTLRHGNGESVCEMYTTESLFHGNSSSQGPIVSFNLKNRHGAWVSNYEVDKLASVRNIHVRTGGLCNPGGIASALNLEPWEMKRNFSAGFRCGNENGIMGGKPTGVIRASLGAMSNLQDVQKFVDFITEFYVEKEIPEVESALSKISDEPAGLFVERLTIYPIKSCGGYAIPRHMEWEVKPEGLAWDREWCLLHRGTGQALSQKRHPRMALIRPTIDFDAGLLKITYHDPEKRGSNAGISVPLSADPSLFDNMDGIHSLSSRVCGDVITAHRYSNEKINEFFSRVLDVPCVLARFPAGGTGPSTRHSKAHMQRHQRPRKVSDSSKQMPGAFPSLPTPPDSDSENSVRPILLSNESPILAINRSSIDALNREILKSGGKEASASVFRANIVIGSSLPVEQQQPYNEDHWSSLRIGQQHFKMLGSCRRCHMICVDQDTAVKDEEPFVTLAKTRRFEGKVFFGSHMCHYVPPGVHTRELQYPTIRVGDLVTVGVDDE